MLKVVSELLISPAISGTEKTKSRKMIEEILSGKNIRSATKQVLSNQGSAGVDGMRVSALPTHLKANWKELSTVICNETYHPQAILGVEIPKSNGMTRLLGIPTVVDRLLQQAFYQVISPKFELEFKEHSYGFRPNRHAHQALQQAQKNIHEGYDYIVDIDLKSFFDEVDHGILLELLYSKVNCPITLRLIRKWLKVPIQVNGKLIKRTRGVPQGSPLSPLLSNIMLHELDKELEKRGHRYVRYADDFSIYTKSKKAARRVGNGIFLFLKNKLKLPINREKSGIRKPVQFQLLGHAFVPTYVKGEKGKYQLIVSDKKWKTFKQKLKRITKKTTASTFDQRIAKLKEIQQGWINYFRMASMQSKLKELDGWLRNRLRYCIWEDWKKPERKRKNLIRLGVNYNQAYAWSRTRMGGWAVAQSPMLGTTITVERLIKRGYQSMFSYYEQVSPQLNEPLYTRTVRTVV
jgi:group II intron reverse transcriptase/maturase